MRPTCYQVHCELSVLQALWYSSVEVLQGCLALADDHLQPGLQCLVPQQQLLVLAPAIRNRAYRNRLQGAPGGLLD